MTSIGGNTVLDYAIAVCIFCICVILIMLLQKLLLLRVERVVHLTHTAIDDALIAMLETIKPPFYWFLAFVLAARTLTLGETAERWVRIILIVWGSVQVIIALQLFIDFLINAKLSGKGESRNPGISGIVSGLAKIGLWVIAILFVLSNLGVNITSLIAGLGIGGIAVALAAQNILGDLFSSLAIYFDKPFIIGDYITIGSDSGTVKKIGIKTTRIQALSGEEISVPNKDIAAARISNLKRMKERRVALKVSVASSTSSEVLQRIPSFLQEIVERTEHTRFKSAYLTDMGNYMFTFELVFYVTQRDFAIYRQSRASILIGIVDTFAAQKIALAAV
jgi:small-conductance mechanosensitive channel